MNSSRLFRCVLQLALALTILAASAVADVKLPAIISDSMVLQASVAVPIWGTADPGEAVTVNLGENKATATAGQDRKWKVELKNLRAGGPFTLEVKGKNELAVKDVLIGEVWLGSGQSNMAMAVSRAKDLEKEQSAATFPNIRMFTVTSGAATSAQADCQGKWVVCSPATVGTFSATAYFFGRELHRELGVPVGLINSSVGGTPIESWISPEAQQSSPELKGFFDLSKADDSAFDPAKAKAKYDQDLADWQTASKAAKAAGKPVSKRPQDPFVLRERKANFGGLFNGKIAPLIPYAIRGALWYQGEANTMPAKAPYYQHQLPLLVRDWRSRWGYDFPVAWVQLPNFTGNGRDLPTVREGMLKTLALPKTGMAITLDIGEASDIHPKNKQDVGQRLALWALGTVYGKSGPTSGPLAASLEKRGSDLLVSFRHTDGGLVARENLVGFEVAGADGKYQPATAKLDGEKVIVANSQVKEPHSARYAWTNNPVASLFNGAGLPASPFRLELAK